jgi:lipoate-protein ligase A
MDVNGRLIVDNPASGAWNMALDAAILECFAPEDSPTLRIYAWSRPTVSLGYFQALSDRTGHRDSVRLELVRRSTGGGAIVHDREITYSLTVPHISRGTGAAPTLYRNVHQAVIESLASMGIAVHRFGRNAPVLGTAEPFLCFQRRTEEDLVMHGYKICGSAQRRGAHAILQHGSILISASQAAPQLPGILELASRRQIHTAQPWLTLADGLREQLVSELGLRLGVTWARSDASEPEIQAARRIETERFRHDRWTAKR